ncbi:chaplin family protein [Nocardiopsis algeriensis]|uniref:Chaplin domain-containing protein n=1 Tax=Nocardiopsis algeriensis TaxID=1478215 RepID=A0A841IIE2_9ACTN|nr:chaplin family protein [Nocardiopsis algeriensis]MBB6118529.1 hypothetical protein [Nocardiopsis algeriensis]
MRNTLRYSFAAAVAAGLAFVPATAAFADATTDGSGSVAGGNQIIVPVDIEADLCGNALSVLGISQATCTKVSEVLYEASGSGGASTDGSGSVAGGNQIIIPVDAAVDACGNAVSVAGISKADCVEVVETLEEESETGTYSTDGSGSVAGGNQIIIPVDAAINICGNSVAVLGGSTAKCTTVINVIQASPENEGGPSTDGSGSVGGGNQVVVPVDVATDICGNAVGVLGLAEASCLEVITEEGGDKPGEDKPGDDEPGNGGGDEPGGDEPGNGDGDKPGEDKPGGDEPGNGDGDKPGGDEPGNGGSEGDKPGTGDDKPAPGQQADGELAVTGAALGGLVAAAVAAIGAGGAGLYFARKRKAAAASSEE